MAVSSSSSSLPVLSPLHFNINKNLAATYSCSSIPLFSVSTKPHNRSSVVVVSSCSGGLTSKDKKLLVERYGFDPNEFLSETKTRRRGEDQKTRRGKQTAEEESKPPRTTHKLLQVLGGKAKRKKLLSPKGMDVRPMMEVVKGAAFDILQVAGGCPASLRPGRWLDLYSGTGSVGIEAISRGCSKVHFVEMDPWVVSNVLQPNLECIGFLDVSVIHTVRVENFLEEAGHFIDGPFDYISVTPPYTEVNYEVLMCQISKSAVVGEDTFIVVEYPLRTDMLDSCGCLVKVFLITRCFFFNIYE
ncbi:uncharacterized protein LOC110820100 isoform X2 [Carica papaya]|uniref:uncharacterized protein LOC110820100 isoform X2 n=1 Tax=Carica papaya TaxID=3649 RepID=UPI000B8D186F|nr:uncharacterized protein LOC110820100 isoform X2 [Carica papaya]